MKRERPAEREIAEWIAPAFERLPAADARRLAAIEQRLLAQLRPRRRKTIAWWWLLGLLAAGAASALWWSVNYDSTEKPVESRSAPLPAADETNRPGPAGRADSTPAGEPAPQRGPTIFEREH